MDTAGESSVIDPLLAVERDDLTGVLEFSAQGITTNVYARAGEIVFADTGTIGETLGRMLLRAGRLTEEQVAAVIRRMTDALVENEAVRFGEVVVEYGFLAAAELELALTQQVKEKLMGCVHRGPGKWTFAMDDPRVDEVGSYVVRTRPMLVEAAPHLPERRIERILHLDESRYPEIVAPESIVAAEFELSSAESLVLRDLDGTSSLHFILSKTTSTVTPLIAALVLGGGVELRTAPTRLRRPSDSRPIPPEFRTARRARFVLPEDTTAPMPSPPVPTPTGARHMTPAPGSASGPKAEERRAPTTSPSARQSAASFSTVAVPPPERRSSRQNLAPPTLESEDRAREALDRLKSDLERKKPVSRRKRWPDPKDDRERRLMAESAFHQGRLFLRAEDAERALPGLHRAFELCPEQHEYELYVKWAQMLVNDTFKDETHRREARQLAMKVVKEDRDCELAFSILGHCAMHDGKDDAALRLFQRAAKLDPKLVDAARLARLLAMRAANAAPRTKGTPESQRTTKARGLLDTPLDEIVPLLLQKAGDVLTSAMNGASTSTRTKAASTPEAAAKPALPLRPPPVDATLEGVPPPAAAAVERLPSSTPSPPKGALPSPSMPPRPPPELSPPPAPARPPPSPWTLPARNEPARASAVPATAPQPLTPRATESSPRPGVPAEPLSPAPIPSPLAAAPAQPLAPAPIAAVAPPPLSSPRGARFSMTDLPTGAPRRGPALVAGWIASLGLTAAGFYALGARSTSAPEPARTPTESTPAPSVSAATAAPMSAASTASGPSATALPASAALSATAATSAAPTSNESDAGANAKTGILRTPKAFGRRVFVDGHIIGEGGRDHTITCGPHRIRVGSAGAERQVAVPCGGTIELD